MRTEKSRIQFIRAALQSHTNFWDSQRHLMRKYRNAYLTKFYEDHKTDDTQLRVETADGYVAVESIQGSLFVKYPSVEIKGDIRGTGDITITRELANNFIRSQRNQIEAASRMSLIYTHSFLKLAPRESDNILGKIAMRAIPPWQVILDRDASAWEDARFNGHCYYIPVEQANEIFGNKDWKGTPQKDYFTDYEKNNDKNYLGRYEDSDLPNEFLYIEIVEMYDYIHNELLFWSPQFKNGDELLSKNEIPVTTFDGKPLSPIVPYYYGRSPDRPMEGYSVLARTYDQISEKNILRTFWANAVRRDTRQYIYKEGAFDGEALAKITAGIDGAMIPTDADSLAGLIDMIPNAALGSNQSTYLDYIEQDLNKGSLTAGFTRGEASKASATEITALMQYSANELGKMAKDRDTTLEAAILVYVRMLIPLLDDKEKLVIVTDDGAKVVTEEAINADWTFFATDSSSTPMSDMIKKQQLLQLLPSLVQLGVQVKDIKAELIRLFDLPPTFAEEAPPAPTAPPMTPTTPPTGLPE